MSQPRQFACARRAVRFYSNPKQHALAISIAIAIAAGAFVSTDTYAQAQSALSSTSAAHAIDLPAGPLAQSLNILAQQTGVQVIFAGHLTEGKQASALRGSYNVSDALQHVLANSGLKALARDAGTFTIIEVNEAGVDGGTLPAIRVAGVTEGTGSYTTNLTNTATKLNLSLRETPQSVTVMTNKRMADQGLDEISKVLDQTTGLYFHNTNVVGGDSNYIYSRGFELQNYQVNGIPRSNRFGFKNDISDTALIDRVEVVRGASGLLNGIGEPSGAVNLVRKMPTREFQANVAAKVGSWNFKRAEADISGPLTEAGNVRGRLVAVHQDNDTFMDRVNMKKDILYGVAEMDLSPNTILSAGIEYQNHHTSGAAGAGQGTKIRYTDGSFTNFSRSTNMGADWSYTDRENITVFSTLEHYFDNAWRLQLDVEHSRREHDIIQAGLVNNITQAGSGTFRAVRYGGKPQQSSVGVHAVGPYELFGRTHELVVGASYSQMEGRNWGYRRMDAAVANGFDLIQTGYYPRGDMGLDGSRSTTYDWQSGLYTSTRFKLTDNTSLMFGGRISNWETRTDRVSATGVFTRGVTSKESSVFTPYAGIVFDATKNLSIYGSYTDIFQPASSYDVNGNLLKPAEGSNIEGGVKLAFLDNKLNLSAAYFETNKDNVPEYVPGPGGTVNYGPTGQYVYRGVNGTKTTGFELEISGQITPNWQASGGYSYANPKDANGNARLTYIPRRTLKLFTSYRPVSLVEGLTLGANVRWQDRIYDTMYSQNSFAVVDLMAQYAISRNLVATLNFNNIFDKSYYTNIQLNNGWYGEPRSAFLNLRYSFK